MISASNAFLAALAGPVQQHTGRIRLHEAYMADYYSLGTPTLQGKQIAYRDVCDLPVVGNPELTIDGRSSVMRSMTFDVPVTALLNLGTSQALSPERLISGYEVSVFKGVVVSSTGAPLDSYLDPYADPYASPGGTAGRSVVEVQVARLCITDARLSVVPGQVTITAVDRMIQAEDYPLPSLYAPAAAGTYRNAIYHLLDDTVPIDLLPGGFISQVSNYVAPWVKMKLGPGWLWWKRDADSTSGGLSDTARVRDAATFTGSRADALVDLAKSVGGIIRNRPDGEFEVVPAPPAAGTSYVWRFASGQNGLLVDVDLNYSRAESFNGVGVTWASTDGTTSGRVFVYDSDPASPTYWLGPFGKKPRPDESLDLVETAVEAETAAAALLASYKGRPGGVSITGVCNPLLLPGDAIQVTYPDRTRNGSPLKSAVHVIDSLSYPLLGGAMNITTREVRA